MTACPICGEPLGEDGLCVACLLGDALETQATRGTESAAPASGDDLAFDNFGPYMILRVLGEGGMGAVYLAEQHEPIRRKVALKVIKPGLDSHTILSRFNYERQAVAMMDHPNIARVYDASATAKGRPYFVMEYVDGVPITAYCDRHRLNTRQRLDLFIPVCQAVQHAHSKGILHRDIKPSNVLVTEIDGAPVPKVIDFGIAKATDQQKYEHTAFTEFGQFVGTPEYMSPEAADLVGGGVDTTSDVYSLGVLLYELMVGAVPFDAKALRKVGLAELLRVLREEDAPSLPAKLTSLGRTLDDIAARRASTPIGLRKEVSGELNLITLKAVEKDRTRRYESARALGEDIERFLDSRPVKACPPTLSYRLRKYGAKHRGAVAAAAALLFAVTAGAGATIWQARKAVRERAIAVAERTEAIAQRGEAVQQRSRAEAEAQRASAEMRRATEQEQRAAASAQDVRSLANSMLFELDDQLKDTGSIATRTKLLDLGLRFLEKASASDPNLGSAYFRVAELQTSLGDRDRAEAGYRRAAELLGARLALDPRESESRRLMARTILALAKLQVTLDGRPRKFKEAEERLRSLIADEPRNARAMLDLSRVLLVEASFAEVPIGAAYGVDQDPSEAVAWAEKGASVGGNRPSDLTTLAEAQMQMSGWVVNQANASEDIVWAGRAVATLEKASREMPSNTTVLSGLSAAYLNLANHHADRDEPAKAAAAANRAVETARQAVAVDPENPSHRTKLARSQGRVAELSAGVGTLEQYRTASEEAARTFREQIARHPEVLGHRLSFAAWTTGRITTEWSAGNYREGLKAMEEAIETVRYVVKRKPSDARARAVLYQCLGYAGSLHVNLREYDQARASFEEALAGARVLARLGYEFQVLLADFESRLGDGFDRMGQSAAALEHKKAAAAMVLRARSSVGTDRHVLSMASYILSQLAAQCLQQLDSACARSANEELRPALEAKYAENPYDPMVTQALWSNLLQARTLYGRAGQNDALIAASRRSLDIAKKLSTAYPGGQDRSRLYLASGYNLSLALGQSGLRDDALVVNREAAAALSLRLASPPSQTEARLSLLDHAGYVIRYFQSLSEPAEGLQLGLRAISLAEAIVQNDPNNQRAAEMLQTTLAATSLNALNAGRLAEARDMAVREGALRSRSARTSVDFFGLGYRQLRLANLEERMRNTEAAARGRDAAVETLRKAYDLSARALAESKGQSIAEMSNMQNVRLALAAVSEHRGQLDAARRATEEALELADRVAAAQNTVANRNLQSDTRARLFRLLDLTAAGDAEYQRRSGQPEPLTTARKQALVANGWRLAASDMSSHLYDPSKRIPAAERAIAGYRALVREGTPATQRVDLAVALYNLASAHEVFAQHGSSQAEIDRHLEALRSAVQESVEILESLRAAGTLPETSRGSWSASKNLLASVQSKLPPNRAAATVSNR